MEDDRIVTDTSTAVPSPMPPRRTEIGRVAIRLPASAPAPEAPRYLGIAWERAADGTRTAAVLANHGTGLPFLAQADTFATLCLERAAWTIDGHLQIRAARVKPERYLKLWRLTLRAAICPQQFLARYRARPLAMVTLPGRGVQASRILAEFPQIKHQSAMAQKHTGDESPIQMCFDLCDPEALKQALLLEELLKQETALAAGTLGVQLQAVLRRGKRTIYRPIHTE